MSSILTNNGAMTALQTLKGINKNLTSVQNEISTGKTIGTARDGAALWAISKTMESDVAGFESVADSLAVGSAAVAVASTGAEQIIDVLTDMKALAASANSETADFTKIDNEMVAKAAQITSIVSASQFNGVNLLATDADGAGGTQLTVLSSLDRSGPGGTSTVATIAVATLDVEAVDIAGNLTSIAAVSDAATVIGEIEGFLNTLSTGAAALGTAGKRIDDQSEFVSKLTDSMKSGIGAIVDADMEAASAKLQALQTQQQLGVQALSIANQAPQSILSLFR